MPRYYPPPPYKGERQERAILKKQKEKLKRKRKRDKQSRKLEAIKIRHRGKDILRAIEKTVEYYMAKYDKAETTQSRIEILCQLSKINFTQVSKSRRKKARSQFGRLCRVEPDHRGLLDYPCFCCEGVTSQCRHHLVPINNGGPNDIWNVIPLCNVCHAEIHPHLKRHWC